MCKSIAEGGQRCSAHAREKFQRAEGELMAAALGNTMTARLDGNAPETVGRFQKAQADWQHAAEVYASTPEGISALGARRHAAAEAGDIHQEMMLMAVLRKGGEIREANRVAADIMAATRAAQAEAAGERDIEHDEECGEDIRMTGACKHGHAFPGGCDRRDCSFADGHTHDDEDDEDEYPYADGDYLAAGDGSAQNYFVQNSI